MKIKKLDFRKVGNHWYPCVNHLFPEQIKLDFSIENYFNQLNKLQLEKISICFSEACYCDEENIIQFEETDILKYLTSDEIFDIRFYVDNNSFKVSSNLFLLLENEFDFAFNETVYTLELW